MAGLRIITDSFFVSRLWRAIWIEILVFSATFSLFSLAVDFWWEPQHLHLHLQLLFTVKSLLKALSSFLGFKIFSGPRERTFFGGDRITFWDELISVEDSLGRHFFGVCGTIRNLLVSWFKIGVLSSLKHKIHRKM